MSLPVDEKWLCQPFWLSKRAHPFVIIMMGLSGTGKSSVSRLLSQKLQAAWLCADIVRKHLFGLDPCQSSRDAGLDIYSADAHKKTFSQLASLTKSLLNSGYPVIIDSAALRIVDRQQFITLAEACHASFVIIHCRAREETICTRLYQRLLQPEEPSEATVNVMEQQKEWLEEASFLETSFLIALDTDQPEWQDQLKNQLTTCGICQKAHSSINRQVTGR